MRARDRRVHPFDLDGRNSAHAELQRLTVLLGHLAQQRGVRGSRELTLVQTRAEPDRAQRRRETP